MEEAHLKQAVAIVWDSNCSENTSSHHYFSAAYAVNKIGTWGLKTNKGPSIWENEEIERNGYKNYWWGHFRNLQK